MKKCLMFAALCTIAVPGNVFAQSGQAADSPQAPATSTATPAPETPARDQVAPAELPDSPGVALSKAQNQQSQQDDATQPTNLPAPPTGASQGTPPQNEPQSTQQPQRPVGTAAAEAPKVSGITAAQPAGVAIAPAKQHRVRTIVLRVGAIVGAGVAVGTVIALSEASPSRPPGAR
jgi:hypothetical protein